MSVHITFLRGLGVKTAGVYHGGLTYPYEGPLPCRLSSENEKLDRTASCTSLMNNIRQRLGGFQVKRAVVATRRGLMLVYLPGNLHCTSRHSYTRVERAAYHRLVSPPSKVHIGEFSLHWEGDVFQPFKKLMLLSTVNLDILSVL